MSTPQQPHHHSAPHDHAHRHDEVAAPSQSNANPQTAPAPGTIFTCPMHAEIRRDQPGTCPKCGMTLEPLMPTLEEDENPELADFQRRFWWTLPLTIVSVFLATARAVLDVDVAMSAGRFNNFAHRMRSRQASGRNRLGALARSPSVAAPARPGDA